MKKILHTSWKLFLTAWCVFTLVCTAGCGIGESAADSTSVKTALCMVLGNHANSMQMDFSCELVQNLLEQAARSYGCATVISVDGSPERVAALSEDFDIEDRFKNADESRLKIDATAKVSAYASKLTSVCATDEEADYLGALRQAARTLRSMSGYGEKVILVAGTGLSTSGLLDFRNNLLCGTPEAVVAALKEQQALIDFSGISVFWMGMGDTAAPQEALRPDQVENMWGIYQAIVEAGGGTFERCDISPLDCDAASDLPTVSTVQVNAREVIRFDPEILETEGSSAAETFAVTEPPETTEAAPVFTEPVSLGEEQIAFVDDRAEYLNPEAALETLRPIADYLVNSPTTTLCLFGCTAGDTESETTRQLSADRAEAVKASLTELGADPDQLIAVGLGSTGAPWHIWNAGVGTAGAVNRHVVLLDASTETAATLLAQYK